MRVLLANECGSGLGHYVRLAKLSRRLRARGAQTLLATHRLDDVHGFAADFDAVAQAPVWPGLFAERRRERLAPPANFADILAQLGFDEMRHVLANQLSWNTVFDHWRPDVTVADYAPGAVLAAKSRCPSMQIGAPFCTPALDGEVFPRFFPGIEGAGGSERRLLAAIDEAMQVLQRPVPHTLADAIIADASLPAALPEFDPYRGCRKEPLLPPEVERAQTEAAGDGAAVFAYLAEWTQFNDTVMSAVATLGLPLKLYIPNLLPARREALSARGVKVADRHFSPAEVAAEARILVHLGGIGMSHMALLAGVPQVVLASDLEKALNAHALVSLDVATALNYSRLDVVGLCATVRAVHADARLGRRARALAASLRERLPDRPSLDIVADGVMAMAGGA